jgi:hypothetical protein
MSILLANDSCKLAISKFCMQWVREERIGGINTKKVKTKQKANS